MQENPPEPKTETSKPPIAALVAAGVVLLGVVCGWPIISQMVAPSKVVEAPAGFHRPDKHLGKTLTQWSNEIEKNPEDPELYFNRGTLHALRDERTNAIDDFTEALKLKPDYLQALGDRSFAYMITAQYDKALADANKMIVLAPRSADGYAKRGMVYEATEMFSESVGDYERAISIEPENAYYYYGASLNLLRLGLYHQVERQLKKAVKYGEDRSFYRANLGLSYTFRQKYDRAIEFLNFDPADRSVRGAEWAPLAYYYVCVGKMDDATKALVQLKTRETFPARAHRMAGEILRCAGQYEKAMHEFSSSTSLEEYPPGYRQKAITALAMGQTRSAYIDLKKSLQLNPKSSTTLTWLARVENKLGMKKEAEQHFAEAFKAKMVAPISFVNSAAAKLENGDALGALADANAAVKRDLWLKEAYEIRAAIRKKLNDPVSAAKDTREASYMLSHFDI